MTPTTFLYMGLAWLLLAGAFLVTAGFWLRRLVLLSRRGRTAPARVERHELRDEGGDRGWVTTFSFVDSRGRELSVRSGLSTTQWREGQ